MEQVIDDFKLWRCAGEKFPLMQHSMRDGPGLHRSRAGGCGIGIDGNQLDLAGSRGFQASFGIIHDIGSQGTHVLAPRVDESQNHLVTTQGRKGDRLTELISEGKVRCEIACHEKATACPTRCTDSSRLCGCLAAIRNQSSASPDCPVHDYE